MNIMIAAFTKSQGVEVQVQHHDKPCPRDNCFGLRLLLGVLMCWFALAPIHAQNAESVDEFVGPLPTWKNVKTDFGAVGDGQADDTEALQKALDSLARSNIETGEHHLWFPAGTYRITRTLVLTNVAGIALLGEHPEQTVILWDGPDYSGEEWTPLWNSEAWIAWDGRHPAEMLWYNGRHSRIARLTFDGAGRAAVGLAYKWHDRNDKNQTHSTGLSVHDCIFRDLAIGIDGGGKQLWLDSEATISRCRFERCTRFGIGLRHFNAVNYWIRHCLFVDCAVGVSNEPLPHGGSFHVYESIFLRSQIADATIYHTQYYSLRNNLSIGSSRFFLAKHHEQNGAYVSLTGNRIFQPGQSDPIRLEQTNAALIAHNTIVHEKLTDQPSIVVGLPERAQADAVVVANHIYHSQAATPIQITGQSMSFENQVSSQSLQTPTAQFIGFQPNFQRRIFPVRAGSDTQTIQAAIDQAAAYAREHPASRPVVHLARGRYDIVRTLVVPAQCDVQIVGDQYYPDFKGTYLIWKAPPEQTPRVILKLQGPSQASLKYLGILGPKNQPGAGPLQADAVTSCILLEDADQPGARVHLQESDISGSGVGLLVDRLTHTCVQLFSHQGDGFGHGWKREWDARSFDMDPYWPYPSIRVIGRPDLSSAHPPHQPGVWAFGTNTGRFQVLQGGHLLVQDTWYENNSIPFYTSLSGDGLLTIDNMFGANFDHPTLKNCTPTYDLKDFTGTLTLINHQFPRPHPKLPEEKVVAFRGQVQGATLLTINLRAGHTFLPDAVPDVRQAHVNFRSTSSQTPSAGTLGQNDPAWLIPWLNHTLKAHPLSLHQLPPQVTDVRLFRVFTRSGRSGMHLIPSSLEASP